MNRHMRIAYFNGTMKPGHDGVTRVLYRLIESLNRRSVENVFFSPLIPPEGERPTLMFEVPSFIFPWYKEYRVAWLPGKRFEDQLSDFKPDILHINSPCSLGYAAVRYAQRHTIPVVATYHTHFASYAKYYNVKALELFSWSYFRMLYNNCDRVFVPSQPILSELNSYGIRNLEFLPHGVDANTFSPQFRSMDWKHELGLSGKNVLLSVGRLVWEKDLRTLAETYRILSNRRSDFALVLAGDGPIREELQTMMPGAVFLGHQSGERLSRAYASSDILVFPSTTETFGNVVVEAMASGLVPVCADEGGAHGNVRDGLTGMITPARDPDRLASTIEILLDHPGKRAELADQALRYARSQSWEVIFDRLLEHYVDIIQGFAKPRARKRRRAA